MDEVEKQVFKDAVKANNNRLMVKEEEKIDVFDMRHGYQANFVKRRALFDEFHENNTEVIKSLAYHKTKWKGDHGYFKRDKLDGWFASQNQTNIQNNLANLDKVVKIRTKAGPSAVQKAYNIYNEGKDQAQEKYDEIEEKMREQNFI